MSNKTYFDMKFLSNTANFVTSIGQDNGLKTVKREASPESGGLHKTGVRKKLN